MSTLVFAFSLGQARKETTASVDGCSGRMTLRIKHGQRYGWENGDCLHVFHSESRPKAIERPTFQETRIAMCQPDTENNHETALSNTIKFSLQWTGKRW